VDRRVQLPVIGPLVDGHQRQIRYLRVSLTDRCNYRCTYCMPEEGVDLLPKEDILSFEEIERLVRIFAGFGVTRVRLTGGEPTIRRHVTEVVQRLVGIAGIEQVVMTTNGHRLPELAGELAAAGLAEVNVSLDTVDPDRFKALTRRGDLERVIHGIDAALEAGMRVKLNAVALRGHTASEVGALCDFAWQRGLLLRFIEHMPMSDGSLYRSLNLVGAAELRGAVEAHTGIALEAVDDDAGDHGPSRYWQLVGQPDKRIGIISAMTEHFCDTCNRVRLSSVGALHTCLAHDDATNLRALLRGGATDEQLRAAIEAAVLGKRVGHEFATTGVGAPKKHMVSIGG
jgi:cyclic pyranopterin phosphate synthase